MPKLTVVTRKAYGGAYDVMNSKHMLADFNFAWPTAEVAVMGPEGAVNIIYRRDIQDSPTPDERRQKLMDDYKARFANPYTAAERGYIDDVIVPHETRPKLIRALETLQTKRCPGRSASTGTSRCSSCAGGEGRVHALGVRGLDRGRLRPGRGVRPMRPTWSGTCRPISLPDFPDRGSGRDELSATLASTSPAGTSTRPR